MCCTHEEVTLPFSSETGDHAQIYFIGMQPDTQANSGSYVALSGIWKEYQLKCGESVPGKWRQLSLLIKHIVAGKTEWSHANMCHTWVP